MSDDEVRPQDPKERETRKFTAVSLFCGAGGLDMGFATAGFETVWANDFDRDSCDTFAKWSGSARVVCSDVADVAEGDVPDADVMLGGFPCQGFSFGGPRKVADPRNRLYRHYVRLVSAKMPLAFVGENVKGLAKMAGGAVFARIRRDFSDCGYDVFTRLVDAADFGVPENRERVVLMGFRKDLGVADVGKPATAPRVTMRDAIGGFAEPGPDDVCRQPFSPRYMSRNRKRGWDDVSFTIPAMAKQVPLWPGSPDMFKVGPDRWSFGDGATRRLSCPECAAIQTFPAGMEFAGDLESRYRQIGNAVPPRLARAVAELVRSVLEGCHV